MSTPNKSSVGQNTSITLHVGQLFKTLINCALNKQETKALHLQLIKKYASTVMILFSLHHSVYMRHFVHSVSSFSYIIVIIIQLHHWCIYLHHSVYLVSLSKSFSATGTFRLISTSFSASSTLVHQFVPLYQCNMYVRMYVCMYVCNIYVHMYACMNVCM